MGVCGDKQASELQVTIVFFSKKIARGLQGQGMHDDGSMDPDDDLAGDDGKSDDMTNVFHGAHAHMHSIPHNPHPLGQPVPGNPSRPQYLLHGACFDHSLGCIPLQDVVPWVLHDCEGQVRLVVLSYWLFDLLFFYNGLSCMVPNMKPVS